MSDSPLLTSQAASSPVPSPVYQGMPTEHLINVAPILRSQVG